MLGLHRKSSRADDPFRPDNIDRTKIANKFESCLCGSTAYALVDQRLVVWDRKYWVVGRFRCTRCRLINKLGRRTDQTKWIHNLPFGREGN